MKIHDFRNEFVYHSPQYPGYTCWSGLYTMPDDSVMCCFTQATGPFRGRQGATEAEKKLFDWPPAGHESDYDMTGLDLQNVHLQSHDFGRTWENIGGDHFKTCMNGVTGMCELALNNGEIIRCVEGMYLPTEEVPHNGYLQRSKDGGRTWGHPEVIYPREGYLFIPKRIRPLRDGRLLIGGGLIRIHPEHNHREGWYQDFTTNFFVSEDEGKSWKGPIDIVPSDQDKQQLGMSEELDWVELPDGDLLVVIRADYNADGHKRLQTRMKKTGESWLPTKIVKAPFPHSGHPEMLRTREGIVFHFATTAISWTVDEGQSWHDLDLGNFPFKSALGLATGYYPRSVQMANGEVLIVGHVGGDNGYGQVDQSIIAVRFSHST